MHSSAVISPCGRYRTRLDRIWNRALPMAAWCALNPSKADGKIDDPSVRKMIGFSARNGYGGFALFNLLSFRATYPRELLFTVDPIGANWPALIAEWCRQSSPDQPIVAWGSIHERWKPQAAAVLAALGACRCLGYTKAGQPRHPLMVAYSTPLQAYAARA